ncbi:hypothetical protein [Flectobacillus major]|uniref:hypothetical protein n=1 Tax=Flectobacillus major TaxID=103 RepID=UPI00040440ED|nr:hypothetical protein [Flectobacillus major]
MPRRESQKLFQQSVIIISALMSLAYVGIGIFLVIFPKSAFAQVFFPSDWWSYAWGAVLIIYGIYRGWRAYEKYKEDSSDDEDDTTQYRYYDGKKG